MILVYEYNDGKIQMKYAKFGSGARNFVILPGISVKNVTDGAKSLEKRFKKLGEKFTVYVFDRKENPSDDYTLFEMSEDTVTVLKNIGVEKMSLYGASQGGVISMITAAKHPNMVEKMILASTAAVVQSKMYDGIKKWVSLAENKKCKELAENFAENLMSDELVEVAKKVFAQDADYSDYELKRFAIMARSMKELDITELLSNIKCKTFIFGSVNDKLMTVEGMKKIAELIENSELYLYEKYGHAVYDEAPDVVERIVKFLD